MANLDPPPVQTPYGRAGTFSYPWIRWFQSIQLQILSIAASIAAIQSSGVKFAVGLPTYANNAAAVAGGLKVGALYRTGGDPDAVSVVH